MAKAQKRSNRELKKPKKKKDAVAAPTMDMKGISALAAAPKKKG